jgi:Zn-dependent protease/CBS domain-containing protein
VNWSFKLLRVKGIDVRVHVTFALILVWAAIVWSSGGGGLSGALFGVVAMLLLFACITLHELGHSLQAMRYGIAVREILLLPIGGVSQIEKMPEKPGQELLIALVGPVVSLGLAAVFYLAALGLGVDPASGLDVIGRNPSWSGLLAYLALANLFLALFNLLPALPMDGGRILRALLAMRLDYRRATAIAAGIGQAFALGAGLVGFVSGNLLLVLIAIFVWFGAGQEAGQAEERTTLSGLRVGQAMTRKLQTVLATDPLATAVDLTLSSFQGDFPVLDPASGRVVGLLTRRDLVHGLHTGGADTPIGQVMRTTYVTARSDDPLFETQRRMATGSGESVVVIDGDGALVGLLTPMDLNEAIWLLAANRSAAHPIS